MGESCVSIEETRKENSGSCLVHEPGTTIIYDRNPLRLKPFCRGGARSVGGSVVSVNVTFFSTVSHVLRCRFRGRACPSMSSL